MNYSFHPDAETEFVEAIDYYEARGTNLGLDFSIEVHETIERIAAHPAAWSKIDGEMRRCQTKRYPYGVVYAIEGDGIYILAVMHNRRHPDYWKSRTRL